MPTGLLLYLLQHTFSSWPNRITSKHNKEIWLGTPFCQDLHMHVLAMTCVISWWGSNSYASCYCTILLHLVTQCKVTKIDINKVVSSWPCHPNKLWKHWHSIVIWNRFCNIQAFVSLMESTSSDSINFVVLLTEWLEVVRVTWQNV